MTDNPTPQPEPPPSPRPVITSLFNLQTVVQRQATLRSQIAGLRAQIEKSDAGQGPAPDFSVYTRQGGSPMAELNGVLTARLRPWLAKHLDAIEANLDDQEKRMRREVLDLAMVFAMGDQA